MTNEINSSLRNALQNKYPDFHKDLTQREKATEDIKAIALEIANDISRRINRLQFTQETKEGIVYPHQATLEYLIEELQKRV